MVSRIWRAFALQPHRVEGFKFSKDPLFIEKVRDVVGLYLHTPERALVLCVDEKAQIQALDRRQLVLPMRPGQAERRTPDYLRYATTNLFAATYEELRRLASTVKGRDKSDTLNPTALVHEAWLKLSSSADLAATSQLHFKRMAARAMRQVLIEAARRRNSLKRGGGEDAVFVTMDGLEAHATLLPDELLDLPTAAPT